MILKRLKHLKSTTFFKRTKASSTNVKTSVKTFNQQESIVWLNNFFTRSFNNEAKLEKGYKIVKYEKKRRKEKMIS